MNKKGIFLENAVMYGLSILIIAIVAIFMFIIVNGFNDGIQDTNTTRITEEVKDISNTQTAKYENLDRAFGFILLAFIVMGVILARKMDEVQPVYVVFGILGLIAIGLFGMIVENVWSGFVSQGMFADKVNSLTFIPFIMNNLLISLVVIVALIVVARLSRDVGGGI